MFYYDIEHTVLIIALLCMFLPFYQFSKSSKVTNVKVFFYIHEIPFY
jgi:hypothetical protein